MRHLHIDLETYSEAPLPKVGAYRYAQDPTTRVLLMAYSYGGAPELLDFERGDTLPASLVADLTDPGVIKWAHNASFERAVISNVLGIQCAPEQWRCTMVWAMSLSLPGGLGSLSEVLKLGDETAKQADGKRLIHKFCTPSGQVQRDLGNNDWQRFAEYCRQDVRAEMAVADRLKRYAMPDHEWAVWAVDQHVNDNGLPIDLPLVEDIRKIAGDHRVSVETLAGNITGLDNPNSRQQMLGWLSQRGVQADEFTRNTVDTLLSGRNLPDDVRQALECRQQLAKASISKYDALSRATGEGGRLRGAFQYSGAGRTGRWCLAEGTEVLCKNALTGKVLWLKIEDVTTEYLVHDGDGWVSHDGVVSNGEREVMTYAGLTATPQHIVWTSPHEKMTLAEAESRGLPIWKPDTSSTA